MYWLFFINLFVFYFNCIQALETTSQCNCEPLPTVECQNPPYDAYYDPLEKSYFENQNYEAFSQWYIVSDSNSSSKIDYDPGKNQCQAFTSYKGCEEVYHLHLVITKYYAVIQTVIYSTTYRSSVFTNYFLYYCNGGKLGFRGSCVQKGVFKEPGLCYRYEDNFPCEVNQNCGNPFWISYYTNNYIEMEDQYGRKIYGPSVSFTTNDRQAGGLVLLYNNPNNGYNYYYYTPQQAQTLANEGVDYFNSNIKNFTRNCPYSQVREIRPV